jgi:hypothetical protein
MWIWRNDSEIQENFKVSLEGTTDANLAKKIYGFLCTPGWLRWLRLATFGYEPFFWLHPGYVLATFWLEHWLRIGYVLTRQFGSFWCTTDLHNQPTASSSDQSNCGAGID